MVIYPESFSVKPESEATVSFRNLFNTTAQTPVKKNLTLLKGNYVFLSKNAERCEFCVSNTIPEKEYKGKDVNIHKAAIVINGVRNMEIDCNDSTFITDGKVTNLVLRNCDGITIKNLTLATVVPNVHKLTVTKASHFYATFEIDSADNFEEADGEFYWNISGSKMKLTDFQEKGGKVITADPSNYNHFVSINKHPLHGASSIRRVGDRTFNVRFILPKNYKVGQVFYLFASKQDEVGIFVENCRNVRFENVKQSFNYGHSFVAQNSENISLENVDFSPNAKKEGSLTSAGDFVHFSMCRGKLAVKNSVFDACAGSCCCVHGVHFRIVETCKDRITVEFPNPKTYGFQCIHEGDTIAFIDPDTLLEVNRTKVLKVELRDKYYYDITMASYEAPLGVGGFVENISACGDFEFFGNSLNRISGFGVNVQTHGKIKIESNKFLNTGKPGVAVLDDAHVIFESGYVTDMEIKGNAFMNCERAAVLVEPNVKKFAGPVHKNILIENNLFVLNETNATDISYAHNVTIKENTYGGDAKNGVFSVCDNVSAFVTDKP